MSFDQEKSEKVEKCCGNCEMFKPLKGNGETTRGECEWKILSPVPFWAEEMVKKMTWGSISPRQKGCKVFWEKEKKPPTVVIINPPKPWRR